MSTETERVRSSRKVQIPARVARTGTFILHFVEMVLVMCIAGGGLKLFFSGAAQAGYPDLIDLRFPEFSILEIGILLAIPMAAWMRFRGHEWRPTLEMASTSIILAILLVGAASLGFMQKASMLDWLKRLACPVMLIPMLYRLDLYTSHHASHRRQAHAAYPAVEHSGHEG
jgi:hypothetical protein